MTAIDSTSTDASDAAIAAQHKASGLSNVLAIAGVGSIGAGIIHAAAIGSHSDNQQVVLTFSLLAAAQLAWGVVAMVVQRVRPSFLAIGAAINGAAVVGWILAKTSGIAAISGLAEPESIQLADATAAALAVVSGIFIARQLLVGGQHPEPMGRSVLSVAVFPVAVLTLASMISAGSHSHAGGHDHAGDAHGTEHEVAVNPGPFEADKPVDLSGVPGVTPTQQAAAEDLVIRTREELPQFEDISTLNERGFYSIGDGITGQAEHFINWSYMRDDIILDPSKPESLVFSFDENGDKYLSAAMFILTKGSTMDDVPELGGPLTQWHIHNNLCFTNDPIKPTLALGEAVVGADQDCTPPNVKGGLEPMLHVWIVDNPCGPFAALDGVAGGQVREGEEVVCTEQHAHIGGT